MSRSTLIRRIDIARAELGYHHASLGVHRHECADRVRQVNPVARICAALAAGVVTGYASRRLRHVGPAVAVGAYRIWRFYRIFS